MGQLTGDMNEAVSIRISRARSPNSLRVPGLVKSGQNNGRPKSAEVSRRDNSFTRTCSLNTPARRSGSLCSKSRQNKNTSTNIRTSTSSTSLKVPQISIRRPSQDDTDSDTASCSSQSRSPSPFDFIERENLPPGSPTFRRAMEDLRSESDLSGGDNSDDSSSKSVIPVKKSDSKGQRNASPRRSSAYRVIRHGTRVTVIRNTKR